MMDAPKLSALALESRSSDDLSELVRAYQRGSNPQEAARRIVDLTSRRLFGILRRWHEFDEVEDIMQETFSRFFERMEDPGLADHPMSWLVRVAVNLATDLYRTQQRQKTELRSFLDEDVVDLRLKEAQSAADMMDELAEALSSLPARDRDRIRAIFLNDRDEAIAALGVTERRLRSIVEELRAKYDWLPSLPKTRRKKKSS